ncbi:UNVERIFIED_CONTAM: hypothetical protein HDU68_012652 [Siphonaria sp. JEL0065]|nr:hypothetical protein HDU68_012652 [Siphonaria sp. JEL0065]
MDTLTSLLAHAKHPLVDIEAHCTIAQALELMKTKHVTSLVIYGEKDYWLGAGNTSICLDKKQFIGLVSVLDIILFLASKNLEPSSFQFDELVSSKRVVDLVGQNTESQSLWLGDTNAKLKFALEPMAKGIHRFLIPIYPPTESDAPHQYPKPVDFQLCSQSDVVAQFAPLLFSDDRFKTLSESSISQFMSTNPKVVTRSDLVLPVLTSLASLNIMAVPVVDSEGILADTLSVSDFRAVLERDSLVQEIVKAVVSGLTVGEFLDVVGGGKRRVLKGVVMPNTLFGEAVTKVVHGRIHRLWVVDTGGIPVGVLSLGDMIGGIRQVL